MDTWNYRPHNTTLNQSDRFLITFRSKYHYKDAPYKFEMTGQYSARNARSIARSARKDGYDVSILRLN